MLIPQEYDKATTSEIIVRHGSRPERLIQILHDVAGRFGYVPEAAIRQLADELNLSRADVHGVVSYYHDFRTDDPVRHRVQICQAEACRAMGSTELATHAAETLGFGLGDRGDEISLEAVYCLGNCACAPSVMVDGRTYGKVDGERFDELIGTLGADLR